MGQLAADREPDCGCNRTCQRGFIDGCKAISPPRPIESFFDAALRAKHDTCGLYRLPIGFAPVSKETPFIPGRSPAIRLKISSGWRTTTSGAGLGACQKPVSVGVFDRDRATPRVRQPCAKQLTLILCCPRRTPLWRCWTICTDGNGPKQTRIFATHCNSIQILPQATPDTPTS